jgi:hypothetical protein
MKSPSELPDGIFSSGYIFWRVFPYVEDVGIIHGTIFIWYILCPFGIFYHFGMLYQGIPGVNMFVKLRKEMNSSRPKMIAEYSVAEI